MFDRSSLNICNGKRDRDEESLTSESFNCRVFGGMFDGISATSLTGCLV